ncbi:hypothetical protein [Nonomuraea sp. NPDC050643]|uniref:hypothetical protein n=1 Tax=Nonomuraea sp. NPDC050643 TaxID=3155660 RepID=UPI0033D1B7D4
MTALKLRTPFEGRFKPDRKGFVYAGLEVKVCVARNTGQPIAVSWAPWSLEYESGVVVPAASSYSAEWWDEPLYPPHDHVVRVGRCVRGWIPFEVQFGQPDRVTYTPGSGMALEWTVGG